MKKLAFLLIITLSHFNTMAQTWYFGEEGIVQFGQMNPDEMTFLNTREGCALLQDEDGSPRLYTDGSIVYSVNEGIHSQVTNGSGLNGDESSTQSAIIVPLPESDCNRFVVYTVDNAENDLFWGLQYSIVEFNDDNPNGVIAEDEKNIQLDSNSSEKLTAFAVDENLIWVLAHGFDDDDENDTIDHSRDFYAYRIDSPNVPTSPIISTVGSSHKFDSQNGDGYGTAQGQMKFSHDGTKVALTISQGRSYPYGQFVEVFDFNLVTGQVSNPITITFNMGDSTFNSGDYPYGIEFAPNDNNIIYISDRDDGTTNTDGGIHQVDLTPLSPNNMYDISDRSTAFEALESNFALQLGPNNNIYVAINNSDTIVEISNPGELGSIEYSSIEIEGTCRIGLPTVIQGNFVCGRKICGNIINDQLSSCTQGPGYTHTFQFQNNTEAEVTSVVLNGITPNGVTLSSQFFNFYQNPIQPGAASGDVEVEIQLDTPLEEAQEVCFDVIYLTDGDQCCHYQHCVLLEPVDPCEFLRIETTETAENCCYEINAVNDYCADFFVGIQMDIQTDGVVFSSYNEDNDWVATPNEEMTTIFWSMEEGNLSLGALDPMSFCLGGISSVSQIPQSVVVSWIVLDPATGEEIAFCEETLEFFCEPCLMLDGAVECSEEGTYTYDYSISNNSDHITNMIVFEVHTPNVLFDPPVVFTILNPGDTYNGLINITSEDGNPLPPNMEIEFKAVLYDAEGWCCHLDDLSLLLPNCEALICDCPDLADFTQQVQSGFTATFDCQNNQVQFLANDLGPCDEIQWVMQPLGPGGLQNMNTAGDVPAQFDFTPGVQYRVVMSAQAYDENGSVCSPGNAANYIEVISNDCIEAPVPHVDIAYSEHELLLYPVPASTWLKLEVPKDGIYEWSIFNANGQQIDYQKGNIHQNQPHSLDIAYLPEGIFFVRLKHEDGETRQGRFVKVE